MRPSLKRPDLPSVEPYKATRPAAGLAATALASAIGYEAAVRALRVHTQPFQWMDPLSDDSPSGTAEVRRLAYRPSPFATRLYVGVWYATAYTFGVTAPGTAPKIQIDLTSDAAPTISIESRTFDDIATPRNPARGANLAASGLVDTSGLLLGQEAYTATTWTETPFNPGPLSGGDGWIAVEATAAQILAVQWVEVVSAEV